MILSSLIGFCILISGIEYESRLPHPEEDEQSEDVMSLYRNVRKAHLFGWLVFLFFYANAVVFHPRHFGFGSDIYLFPRQLIHLSVFLVVAILLPTVIMFVVVRPLYFVFDLTLDLNDSKYLKVLFRFQLLGFGILVAWFLIFFGQWW